MSRPQLSFLHPRPQPLWQRTALPAGPPDAVLIAHLGADRCLRWQILPYHVVGGGILIYAGPDSDIPCARAALAPLGQVFVQMADGGAIRARLTVALREALRDKAEACPPPEMSVRSLPAAPVALTRLILPLLGTGLAMALLMAPQVTFLTLLALMTCVLIGTTGFRMTALLGSQLAPVDAGPQPEPVRWPVISVLVPLLEEDAMVGGLIARLAALDYPPAHYELCLVVEEDDARTRAALSRITLPAHAQVIVVPRGRLRTKPRALNFALPFTRGTIIGIYDAEDRPARDQLRQVARHFAHAHPKTVCLQGQLDYFNDRSNWLARCFTLEYCAWFRVILPGLARLGLPVPLGGTTLFLRRHAIEEMGGWDAHNVTEDADLGIRIARLGYHTAVIPTVTEEEANARIWPWIKQRSRWFKGYALTWAVHMRDPRRLWRDLGPKAFWGMQLTLLGALATFLGAPVFWAFALIGIAGFSPFLLPDWAFTTLATLFVLSWLTDLATQILGVRRAGKDHLILWAPATYAYFPLATIAAWRALAQALRDPFTWEKTPHGIYHAPDALTADPPKPAPAARPASGG